MSRVYIQSRMAAWLTGFKENIRFAFNALSAHKMRAVLTIMGVVIGVATIIGMVSIIEGFNSNVRKDFESFGATLVQFQKNDPKFGPGRASEEERARRNLTYEDAQALKRLCPSMAAVSPERYWGNNNGSSPPDVKYKGRIATPDEFGGVTEDYAPANNHYVSEGRFLVDSDVRHSAKVVVIGHEIANALFPHVDAIGKEVQLAGRKFTVIGVMESQGATFFESTDSHVLLPITTFDEQFPSIKRDTGVNIATIPKDPKLVSRIVDEGTAVLRVRRKVPFNKPNDFGLLTPDKLIGNFEAITQGITLAMVFISSISLLVGGVGIANILLVSVTERTREIGIRKALGAVRSDIATQFLTEAMSLSGAGGIIGILVGLTISVIVRLATPVKTFTPLWAIVVGFTVSVTIGLLSGWYPAYKAAKLDPIDALRYE